MGGTKNGGDKKKGQGTWKRMLREMRNDGDYVGECNKKYFKCRAMKRMRRQNEEEGKQQ